MGHLARGIHGDVDPAALQQYLVSSPTILQQYLGSNSDAQLAYLEQNAASVSAYIVGNPAAGSRRMDAAGRGAEGRKDRADFHEDHPRWRHRGGGLPLVAF